MIIAREILNGFPRLVNEKLNLIIETVCNLAEIKEGARDVQKLVIESAITYDERDYV